MQRRQHEVARQRSLDGDHTRLAVSNFADEDDVGVLAQNRAQCVGEGQAGLRIRLHLIDVLEAVLDGILDGHDVARLFVEEVERRVQGGRLARTGRTGDQDRAVRFAKRLLVQRELRRQEAKAFERLHAACPIEDSHHDLLAVDGRKRRYAQVDHRCRRPSG